MWGRTRGTSVNDAALAAADEVPGHARHPSWALMLALPGGSVENDAIGRSSAGDKRFDPVGRYMYPIGCTWSTVDTRRDARPAPYAAPSTGSPSPPIAVATYAAEPVATTPPAPPHTVSTPKHQPNGLTDTRVAAAAPPSSSRATAAPQTYLRPTALPDGVLSHLVELSVGGGSGAGGARRDGVEL